MIVLFIVGTALVFGSMLYFLIALRSTYDGDSMETVDFVRGYQVPWLIMAGTGSLFTILAFALAVYWAYLNRKIRIEQASASEMT